MNSGHHDRHTRRAFLKASAAALCLTGCGTLRRAADTQAPELTDEQRARRFTGISRVAVVPCRSYEDYPGKRLQEQAAAIGLPSLKNKTVVIKPNMIEYRPDRPVTANPDMIAAAAELIDSLGASRIIVAEGPGHFRDTDYLLEATGIGKMCSRLGLPFVDLNLDAIEPVDNPIGLTRLKQFFLPRTILQADAVVSLPKLKTHHWVGMTASMKNLFGTVPGCKYGWPKNLLHWLGIDMSIIDLVHLVRPAFAIVDAVVCMEGDGPINGVTKHGGFMVMGTDLAAVDATCARAIGVDPHRLRYLRFASEVVGNIESARINITGADVAQVRQEFAMPVTFPGVRGSWNPRRHGA